MSSDPVTPSAASTRPAAERLRGVVEPIVALALPLFVLVEVNRPTLTPQGGLSIFAALGLALVFLGRPEPEASAWRRWADLGLAAAALATCLWVTVQSEPALSSLWLGDSSLGDRAGAETPLDLWVGAVGLLLVLEASRRLLGWALPVLAGLFVLYALAGPHLPELLLPHRGYPVERIVAQTFLQSQGVFGIALKVMLSYVFLFVVLGAVLEATGATSFLIGWTRKLFRRSSGAPAKVAVVSSGLLGSLSGSAVANTATTGTFTIPLMRSAGFDRATAAGIEAAASSGGALVPPVMGAGAYMMLEIIDPPVSYLEIVRASLLPAILYYLSLFLIVHFRARRLGAETKTGGDAPPVLRDAPAWAGLVLVGALGGLVVALLQGVTVSRAVTVALVVTLLVALPHPATRLGLRALGQRLAAASRSGVSLIAAAACVGIVIGVVTLTGVGTRLPALLVPLAENNLLGALALLMVSAIVLGMGLPSAVCYLLLATLVGPVLTRLGVVPLAAHLFIFYFGMMSMVTPPVALAAYAASSIAGCRFLPASWAAFRFALAGFTLPYLFVFRPQLLMLEPGGGAAGFGSVALATALATAGIVPLAAALGGHLFRPLGMVSRGALLVSAGLALFPGPGPLLGRADISLLNLSGIALLAAVAVVEWRRRERSGPRLRPSES